MKKGILYISESVDFWGSGTRPRSPQEPGGGASSRNPGRAHTHPLLWHFQRESKGNSPGTPRHVRRRTTRGAEAAWAARGTGRRSLGTQLEPLIGKPNWGIMKPARGPQTIFVGQQILWNHCEQNTTIHHKTKPVTGAPTRVTCHQQPQVAILKSKLLAAGLRWQLGLGT